MVATLSWADLLDRLSVSDCDALLARARSLLTQPVVRRVYRYEDIGKHRSWLDGRARDLEPEIQELFALAMSDHGACTAVALELPILAAAARRTGDPALLRRTLDQLEEMTTWSPLQRSGWCCCAPGARLPAGGRDGNWLATGQGVRAVADALAILPATAVPATLRQRILQLLEVEIAGVVDDWHTRRTWFTQHENPATNQWVLPTEGLVRACLVCGIETHRAAYELGVRNLLKSLDVHGRAGEFEEGVHYAQFTVSALLHAAYAMALTGDRRAIDHPFLRNFPLWLVHHIQPGRVAINCFDAFVSFLPRAASLRPGRQGGEFQALLGLLLVCTGSEVARWALQTQFDGSSDDLAGFAARALLAGTVAPAPPLYAYYERATRINWRDHWGDDSSGVWIRGGHLTDQHDHQDRGHVNFIVRGRPILIEAGTPAYHHPELHRLYGTGAGHNVLQLGDDMPPLPPQVTEYIRAAGWQRPNTVAPLTVLRLDAQGGEVTVDGSACYDGLRHWQRHVSWSATELQVHDEVTLNGTQSDIVLFRWHLGTDQPVTFQGADTAWTVTWPDTRMTLVASMPILLRQVRMPDHTLQPRAWDDPVDSYPQHTCVVARSVAPVQQMKITTTATAI